MSDTPLPARWSRAGCYPWDEWLDGRTWALVQGEDFAGRPKNVQNAAAQAARTRGIKVRTRVEGPVVRVQAWTPDEVAA